MLPVVIIIGPSGIGKTSNAKLLQERLGFLQSITVTTANPRSDNDAEYYHYVSKEEFARMIDAGLFLEWDKFGDNFYGTLLEELEKPVKLNRTGLVICSSPRGYPQIIAKAKKVIGISLLPRADYQYWLPEKLFARGTNSQEDIRSRIAIMEQFIREVRTIGLPVVYTGPDQQSWDEAFAEIQRIISVSNC